MADAEKVALLTAPALMPPDPSAAHLGMGRSTLDRMAAAGLIPAPRKVGGKVLYCRAELDFWAAVGCPDAVTFAPVWAAERTAAGPRTRR